MSKNRTILHGIPDHDYFGIIQPIEHPAGMDCSSIADGLGLTYTLVSPVDNTKVQAILICKRTLYTDSDALEAISYLLYGVHRDLLLDRMHKRYADMMDEVVELWCFKKE